MLALVLVYTWALSVAWKRGWFQKMWETLKEIIRKVVGGSGGVIAKEERQPITHDSVHHYYGGHEITKAVEDVWSPIETVIAAAEHQIRREVAASKSYRNDPSLVYAGHPWMEFVRSGGAEYLGWSRDYSPGPSPLQRRQNEEPAIDLLEHLQKGLLDSGDMVPLITSYDLDGRPIYAKAVPASQPKPDVVTLATRTARPNRMRLPQEVYDPDDGTHLGTISVCSGCGSATDPCDCYYEMRAAWSV